MTRNADLDRHAEILDLLFKGHTHAFIGDALGLERSSISYYIRENAEEILARVPKEKLDKAALLLPDLTAARVGEKLGLPLSIVYLIKKKVLGHKRIYKTSPQKRKCKVCHTEYVGIDGDCPTCNES